MSISEISVQELAALGTGARVVDVREPAEWESAHIAHAVHVPLASVPDQIDVFDGDPTYVVCLSGGRSHNACKFLDDLDGRDVVNVVGGMRAWLDAGLDVALGAAGSAGA